MSLPENLFAPPTTCKELMECLGSAWPSPHEWAWVPEGTQAITESTAAVLLSIDPDDGSATREERELTERELHARAKEARLTPLLSRTQLEDVAASLEHEFSLARTAEDRAVLMEHRSAILMQAVTKYWIDDAFLSVYSWTTKSGDVIPGAIDAYR